MNWCFSQSFQPFFSVFVPQSAISRSLEMLHHFCPQNLHFFIFSVSFTLPFSNFLFFPGTDISSFISTFLLINLSSRGNYNSLLYTVLLHNFYTVIILYISLLFGFLQFASYLPITHLPVTARYVTLRYITSPRGKGGTWWWCHWKALPLLVILMPWLVQGKLHLSFNFLCIDRHTSFFDHAWPCGVVRTG